MKRLCAILMVAVLPKMGFTQASYWQQEVHYNIQVALNEKEHTLNGNLSVEYINHSPDTLTFIWFHLWPNAYKNKNTALAKQLVVLKENEKLANPIKKDPHEEVHETGYIEGLKFEVNKQVAATASDSENIDIIKVLLPQPLLPGKQVTVTTPFHVKLPDYYSRSGYSGSQFFICQWYPKPAVYDNKGWHPIPYLDQGEFYSEYGSFKVDITVPAEYVIGATGTLQTTAELEKYKQIGIANNKSTSLVSYKTTTPGKSKTLQYTGDRMLDFAWFAAKDFVIRYDTLQLTEGKTINVFSYGQPNGNKTWKGSTNYIKDAVRHYSKWIGEYPYPVVQAVEGPKNQSSGGMEYPTITLITSPNAKEEEMDGVITHEVGHNWFMGIMGTNERQYAWMDEGINTYYQFRYEAEKYRSNSILSSFIPKDIKELPEDEFQARIYEVLNSVPAQQPINTPSAAFSSNEEYGIVEYVKTAVWMYTLEATLGRDTLDKGMQLYFTNWQFKHPQPEDLKKDLETASGKNLDKEFALLNKEGKLF
jgi:hypothetical protein